MKNDEEVAEQRKICQAIYQTRPSINRIVQDFGNSVKVTRYSANALSIKLQFNNTIMDEMKELTRTKKLLTVPMDATGFLCIAMHSLGIACSGLKREGGAIVETTLHFFLTCEYENSPTTL